MTNFVQQIEDIRMKAYDVLDRIKEPITFPEYEEQTVTVTEESTYEEDCIIYNVKAKTVTADNITTDDGKEYDLIELDEMSIALLADRVSQIIEEKEE